MTRINTNVSSLTAQKTLARSNASLQQALTRLSTGLRINVGKDDPAGLIASEALRSDINSTNKAISNTQRANEMIATADSALGQVSSLLNDIRGLVTEAANVGAMSENQIAANQLQVDSSLEAINRIAQVTSFQGRRLLDGSLDFITANWTNQTQVSDLNINSANLGTATSLGVNVVISNAATQGTLKVAVDPVGALNVKANAQVTTGDGGQITVTAPHVGTQYNGVQVKFVESSSTPLATPTAAYNASAGELTVTVNSGGATNLADIKTAIERDTSFTANVDTAGTYTVGVDHGTSTKAGGQLTFADGTIINLTAKATGSASNANIIFTEDGGVGVTPGITWDGVNQTQNVKINTAGNTAQAIVDAFNADVDSQFTATMVNAGANGYEVGVDSGVGSAAVRSTLSHALGTGNITFTALTAGADGDNIAVQVIADGADVGTPPEIVLNGNTIEIHIDADEDTTLGAIADAVNSKLGITVDAFVDDRTKVVNAAGVWGPTNLAGGANATRAANTSSTGGFTGIDTALANGDADGGLKDSLVFQLSGVLGTQVFSFQAGATGQQLEAAVNLVSDATGIVANYDGTNLFFRSSGYGSEAFSAVDVISEGALGDFRTGLQDAQGNAATRSVGVDVQADVNGVAATGKGNQLSINSATLSLSMSVKANFAGTVSFDISGGGAMFQLGPDVVSNQQARIGIMNVNSASLSGETGRLYTLGSGEENALGTDPTTAARIVDEVITKVTSLRGRLGAFQKATLESNITSLTDTVENLTAAESAIRDADFAAESANLTRAQILVQSGVSVLSVANQNPQNVLALLR